MTDTVDEALAMIPAHYRLYTIDASVEGSVRVMLKLADEAEKEWHAMGEVLDESGRDVRWELYLSGRGSTMALAINAAVAEVRT